MFRPGRAVLQSMTTPTLRATAPASSARPTPPDEATPAPTIDVYAAIRTLHLEDVLRLQRLAGGRQA